MNIENSDLKDGVGVGTAKELFEVLATIAKSDGVNENEQKEMVAEIINVLRAHKLSYYQAERILEATKYALKAISQQLYL